MHDWGDDALVTSVRGIPAQSPKLKSRDELTTFLWKNCRVVKDHPRAAITLSSIGTVT